MTVIETENKIIVRTAENLKEVEDAQRLRYQVFYDEFGATPSPEMQSEKRDFDPFDDVADHLIVVDQSGNKDKIVGTYRLLRRDIADQHGKFYTSDEYDISKLLDSGNGQLELGRSCVLAEYRTRPVMNKLWQGITNYILDHDIKCLFGCASLYGTDTQALSKQLAYLYHYHLSPDNIRPKAIENRYIDMNLHAKDEIDEKEVFSELPPLIKGYLRVGVLVGDGAVIDEQFNTTDVCMIMPTNRIPERYINHYTRKNNDSNALNSDDDQAPLKAKSAQV